VGLVYNFRELFSFESDESKVGRGETGFSCGAAPLCSLIVLYFLIAILLAISLDKAIEKSHLRKLPFRA
jgi:hypothetical protein